MQMAACLGLDNHILVLIQTLSGMNGIINHNIEHIQMTRSLLSSELFDYMYKDAERLTGNYDYEPKQIEQMYDLQKYQDSQQL